LERVKDQEKRREQENHNVGRGLTGSERAKIKMLSLQNNSTEYLALLRLTLDGPRVQGFKSPLRYRPSYLRICVLVLSIYIKYGVTKQKVALLLRNNETGFRVWRFAFFKNMFECFKGNCCLHHQAIRGRQDVSPPRWGVPSNNTVCHHFMVTYVKTSSNTNNSPYSYKALGLYSECVCCESRRAGHPSPHVFFLYFHVRKIHPLGNDLPFSISSIHHSSITLSFDIQSALNNMYKNS
jgi:hypothetical protein